MTREEAIETIRRCCPKVGDSQCDFESAMRELIPELAESDDERVRKGLIEALKTSKIVGELKFILLEPTREECIAYLEKQKEKEIPKWMPKFLDELRSKKHYFDWDEHRDIEGSILAIIDFIAPDYFTEKDKKEQKPAECIKTEELAEHIKAEFESFRNLLKKKGIDYQPAEAYWADFARLFVSSAKKLQKPAGWSEEDETKLRDVVRLVEDSGHVKSIREHYEKFLTSLPERFNLCPEQEWSEEDVDMLNSCISSIEEAKENRYAYKETDGDTSYDHEIAWLKSLRSSWKPSEEQMAALYAAARESPIIKENGNYLYDLYNDLKKL